jgi:hypothetical protein
MDEKIMPLHGMVKIDRHCVIRDQFQDFRRCSGPYVGAVLVISLFLVCRHINHGKYGNEWQGHTMLISGPSDPSSGSSEYQTNQLANFHVRKRR